MINRQLLFSVLIVFVVSIVGNQFPLIFLFVLPLTTPLILAYINIIHSNRSFTSGWISVLVFVFIIDFIFRFYGGGTYDQAGKSLCDLALLINIIIVFVFLMVVSIKRLREKQGKDVFYKKLFSLFTSYFVVVFILLFVNYLYR